MILPFKLGRIAPAVPGKRMELFDRVMATLPTPPAVVNDAAKALPCIREMLANDTLGDCHDARTEVLTESGWQAWPEYDGHSALGTMNVETGILEFQHPVALQRYEFDGDIFFSNRARLDFALTGGHRMLIKPYEIHHSGNVYKGASFGQQRFAKLESITAQRVALPKATTGFVGTTLSVMKIGNRTWNGDDLLALVALVASDGWVGGTENNWNTVSFCCFRADRREMVESLAHRLGLSELPGRGGVWKFSDGALAAWFRSNMFSSDECFKSPFKRVPSLVKAAAGRQISIFLDYFGDQHVDKSGARTFYSSSKTMMDDLQELCLKIGRRGSICEREPRVGHHVNDRGKIIQETVPGIALHEWNGDEELCLQISSQMHKEPYRGEVFCATVPNSTLVTRRNNQILISGNCTAACAFHVAGVLNDNAGRPTAFTDADAITFYSATSGYAPGDPSTDNGADEVTVLDWWQKNGLVNGAHKISAWTTINAGNPVEVKTALWLFENGIGCACLPDEYIAMMQAMKNGFRWEAAGPPNPNNGHCFGVVGFIANYVIVSTWGMWGLMSWAAFAKYCVVSAGGAAYTVLGKDALVTATAKTPGGYDFTELSGYLGSV